MRPKTRAIVLGAALVTGAAVVGIDWSQYIQKRYPNGSPVPPVINTKQTTLSGGAPLPVSCASGNVSSCMATANQNLLVSACKEVNATPVTAPTASTKSQNACKAGGWESYIVDKTLIPYIISASEVTGVPASQIAAIVGNESAWGSCPSNCQATHELNKSGQPVSSAYGPMQIENIAAEQSCQSFGYCPDNKNGQSNWANEKPSHSYQDNILQGAYLIKYETVMLTHNLGKAPTFKQIASAYNSGNNVTGTVNNYGIEAQANSHKCQ
jgi:hypothetical protein